MSSLKEEFFVDTESAAKPLITEDTKTDPGPSVETANEEPQPTVKAGLFSLRALRPLRILTMIVSGSRSARKSSATSADEANDPFLDTNDPSQENDDPSDKNNDPFNDTTDPTDPFEETDDPFDVETDKGSIAAKNENGGSPPRPPSEPEL